MVYVVQEIETAEASSITQLEFCFEVVTKRCVFLMEAENEAERRDWLYAIRMLVAGGGGGQGDDNGGVVVAPASSDSGAASASPPAPASGSSAPPALSAISASNLPPTPSHAPPRIELANPNPASAAAAAPNTASSSHGGTAPPGLAAAVAAQGLSAPQVGVVSCYMVWRIVLLMCHCLHMPPL